VVENDSLLAEVLAELVSSGVLTQEQSDAITEALTAKAEQRRAEFEAERQRLQQMWTQIQEFLEDDVVTSDEIAQLPEDNPFAKLQDILSDGQITRDELESAAPFGGMFFERGPGRFGPGGPHHGHGWFPNSPQHPGTDPDANADPDSESNLD
jgi:polyhydroxyalkanoate synthesis regulator phasin